MFGARNLPAIVAVLRNVILHLERHDFSLAYPLSAMLLTVSTAGTRRSSSCSNHGNGLVGHPRLFLHLAPRKD